MDDDITDAELVSLMAQCVDEHGEDIALKRETEAMSPEVRARSEANLRSFVDGVREQIAAQKSYGGSVDTANEKPRARLAGESLRDWIGRIDPDVVAAVEDVDRTLIHQALSRSPLERARVCTRTTRGLARFRRVAP